MENPELSGLKNRIHNLTMEDLISLIMCAKGSPHARELKNRLDELEEQSE